jgi:thiosulfate/3-mercaptopyruvate sulfurtransferase
MSWCIPCILAGVFGAADGPAKSGNYPQGRLLMERAEFWKALAADRIHVLDARPLEKYKAGHIFHATPVAPSAWNKMFLKEKDKHFWEKHLGALGIGANTTVVVYGDDFRETARVWWILRYWGVRDVRMLNGGWQGWKASGRKTYTDRSADPHYAPKKAKLSPHPERLAVKDQLLEGLKNKRFQIADARSRDEYCGLEKTAKRNGAIPGARRLEWSDLIDKKSQRFKSAAELTRLLKEAGIDLKKPTVTYCQSGGRASVLAFTLELMGAKDVRNYYRSWAEWGNAEETPIEKHKEK